MCEFLERAGLRGTPTEEVREWSTMTHRVVELCGPFPTPDDMRVELWLHEESATRLLDMCDQIDAKFHKVQAENAKLREIVRDMRKAFFALNIDHCQACPRDTINGPCTKFSVWGSNKCSFEEDMHELGIEVDE